MTEDEETDVKKTNKKKSDTKILSQMERSDDITLIPSSHLSGVQVENMPSDRFVDLVVFNLPKAGNLRRSQSARQDSG